MNGKETTPASSVESKIAKVVETMGNLTYIFDNVTDRKLRDFPNCMLAFIDKTDFDFDGKENDEVLERCKNLAMEFVLTANASGLFEPVTGDVRYSVLYDKLDVNVTGVVIELQLREKQGINLCYGKPIKDYFYERDGEG